jgi:hypothetical protein
MQRTGARMCLKRDSRASLVALPAPLSRFVQPSSQPLGVPDSPRCSLQAIAKAEDVRGNAARPVIAPTLCLCKPRKRRAWRCAVKRAAALIDVSGSDRPMGSATRQQASLPRRD